ncbi:hypothetical protein PWT90_03566 [Aphanocladium album]|nr:hypothetical protein PWT90_03566 [Aphanocladium album]
MIADLTGSSKRTETFARIGVFSMAVASLSRAVSSGLMALHSWIPTSIGIGIVTASLFLSLLLPETLATPPGKETQEPASRFSSSLDEQQADSPSLEPKPEPDSRLSSSTDEDLSEPSVYQRQRIPHANWFASARSRSKQITSPCMFLLKRQVTLLLFAFLFFELAKGSSMFLVQYIPTRFDQPIARANLIVSIYPIVGIPALLSLLPYLSSTVMGRLPLQTKGVYLAGLSPACLTAAKLGTALAPALGILIAVVLLHGAGAVFLLILRSHVTSLVEPQETARLYTAMQLVPSVGSLAATVYATTIFPVGLKNGWLLVGTAVDAGHCAFYPVWCRVVRFGSARSKETK